MKRLRIVLSILTLAALLAPLAGCGGGDGSDGDDTGDGDGAPPPIAFAPPKNPHLADSTWPIFHRDSYAQHSSELRGVEAKNGPPSVTIVPTQGIPIFTLFDPAGDILTVTKGLQGAWLFKIDRETLTEIARVQLSEGGDTFAGAYGYVDAQGRAVVGLGTKISRYVADADSLDLDTSIDVAAALGEGELMVAITVLYSGEIAFAGDRGTIGVVAGDLSSGTALDTLALAGEQVSNGITTDENGGIYVVASGGLRRIDWTGSELVARWDAAIEAPFTEPRPGRLGIGSGTTPALMMDGLVAVADDAESMNLVVVRRAVDTAGAPREACKVPIFDGPATTDNAIVVAGRTLIVAQNLSGLTGVARFDVDESGACTRAWSVPASAPTCVPTLSTASGLVYVYSDNDGVWGLTGLDLATGAEKFFAEAGQGGQFNNYYAAVTIGPDSRVYIGTLSGLVVFSD